MDREELKSYLHHREPMLLLDEAEVVEEGRCEARYRIREDEFFCRGHFPGNPIVPGVVLCEIMAQSCAMLVKEDLPNRNTLYSGIDNVRFKGMVRPGDECQVVATLISRRGPLVFCHAELTVDGKLCCRGDLSFALI